jgi:photosystem II stability/assembly factor-like uncharacterized protein
VGTYGAGVFRSTDSGNTWTAVNDGLTVPVIQALTVSPGGVVIVGAMGGGVFISGNTVT